MKPNKIRELLNAGKPTVSTHIHTTWPSVVEAIGCTGVFDYVEFVAEYAPYDLYDFDNLCRAAELHDVGSMIKVDEQNHAFVAQRAIGSGFQSVLFTDCRSVEAARSWISAVRADTPETGGVCGVATRRFTYSAGFSYGGSSDYVKALDDIVVALMIEKKPAVDQLDEILSLDGVDMIQWGPADYSMSIGRPGTGRSPEVKAVEREVIEKCLKRGVPPRAEIESADAAKYYLDLGVRHFCVGTDIKILHNWLKTEGEGIRKALEE